MALGKLNECWRCYENNRWDNKDFKHTCSLVKGKKGTICQGILIWLCKDCKEDFRKN